MNTEDNYSPARLADRAWITDVLHRYCRGVDRLDAGLIRDSFHPDAIDEHSIYSGGVEGLVAWILDRHRGIRFSMHVTSNVQVEFTGRDWALVECCVQSVQRHAATQPGSAEATRNLMTFARYVDLFSRRDGQWRIQQRHAIYDDIWQLSIPAGAPMLGDNWTCGIRGPGDPSHAIRERFRGVIAMSPESTKKG